MKKLIFPLVAIALFAQGAIASADSGKGHIVLTGAASINADYSLSQCMVRRPGKSQINGLGVVFNPGDKLDSAEVNVIAYAHDGTYQFAGNPALFIGAPVTMNFKSHMSMVQTKGSHSTVVVSHGGASGTATFTNWQSMDNHKPVSGKITWSCTALKKPMF